MLLLLLYSTLLLLCNSCRTVLLLLLLLLFDHRKRLRMIQRSACACDGKRVSSSMDTPRSSLLRSASKAGQQSHKWSYVSSSSLHIRHVASSDLLIRCCQRRSAGWCPLRKLLRLVISGFDIWVSSRVAVWSGVEVNGEEQACRMMALRVAQSS